MVQIRPCWLHCLLSIASISLHILRINAATLQDDCQAHNLFGDVEIAVDEAIDMAHYAALRAASTEFRRKGTLLQDLLGAESEDDPDVLQQVIRKSYHIPLYIPSVLFLRIRLCPSCLTLFFPRRKPQHNRSHRPPRRHLHPLLRRTPHPHRLHRHRFHPLPRQYPRWRQRPHPGRQRVNRLWWTFTRLPLLCPRIRQRDYLMFRFPQGSDSLCASARRGRGFSPNYWALERRGSPSPCRDYQSGG